MRAQTPRTLNSLQANSFPMLISLDEWEISTFRRTRPISTQLASIRAKIYSVRCGSVSVPLYSGIFRCAPDTNPMEIDIFTSGQLCSMAISKSMTNVHNNCAAYTCNKYKLAKYRVCNWQFYLRFSPFSFVFTNKPMREMYPGERVLF